MEFKILRKKGFFYAEKSKRSKQICNNTAYSRVNPNRFTVTVDLLNSDIQIKFVKIRHICK